MGYGRPFALHTHREREKTETKRTRNFRQRGPISFLLFFLAHFRVFRPPPAGGPLNTFLCNVGEGRWGGEGGRFANFFSYRTFLPF